MYIATDFQVRVEGTVAGVESWANTWSFKDDGPGSDIQDVASALNAFYADIADPWWTTDVFATNASYRRLDGGAHGDLVFPEVQGATSTNLLPTECALRLTLSTAGGNHGGPFLAGFAQNGLEEDGTALVGLQGAISDALEQLNTDVLAAGWLIGLDSPTQETVLTATQGRVGRVFDVQRRRRNQLPENYAVTVLGA